MAAFTKQGKSRLRHVAGLRLLLPDKGSHASSLRYVPAGQRLPGVDREGVAVGKLATTRFAGAGWRLVASELLSPERLLWSRRDHASGR